MDKRRSGIPEILALKAMVPCAKAETGRPEGANITERISTMSTYSSFDVCFTFERRHSTADPAAELAVVLLIPEANGALLSDGD